MIDWLITSGLSVTLARQFADPLAASMALNDISTPSRKAGFLAQCMVESEGFTRLEENLRYTTERAAVAAFGKRVVPHLGRILRNPKAMANFVYADRNGNGNEASGDGWNYRGRGIIGLTGLDNYRAGSYGVGLGTVYVQRPELVAEPRDACAVAAWFWRTNGCNQLVDAGNFDTTTTRVNGKARLHADRRLAKFTALNITYGKVYG